MNSELYKTKLGFRSGKTTTDCLVDIIEEITIALDEGSYILNKQSI